MIGLELDYASRQFGTNLQGKGDGRIAGYQQPIS